MRLRRTAAFLTAAIIAVAAAALAYEAPFITSADKVAYINDTTAIVASDGSEAMVFYPGIQGLAIDGKKVKIRRINTDLVAAKIPAGQHRLSVTPGDQVYPAASEQKPVSKNAIATPEALAAAVAKAQPGDTVVVRNGVYVDWRAAMKGAGAEGKPVTIRPETPGGVVFTGNTKLLLEGKHLVFREFIFEQTRDAVLILAPGESNRVTQCQFFFCGSPVSTFPHTLQVRARADHMRIDHCYFTGMKSMSIGILGMNKAPETAAKSPHIDHNVFRDIHRIWVNGQENVQIGQGMPWNAKPHALVEFNLFHQANGDGEIFSFKTQENTARYNVAAHCRLSAFTFRGGQGNRLEGNMVVDCMDGLRMFHENHVIVNNLFLDCRSRGIVIRPGHPRGKPSRNCLIANNTFVGGTTGICISGKPIKPEYQPSDNTIRDNIFVSGTGKLIDPAYLQNFTIDNNLLYAVGAAEVGEAGKNAILADPKLTGEGILTRPAPNSPAIDAATPLPQVAIDRWGLKRPVGKAPDIGADEIGAGGADKTPLVMPDVPDFRPWSLAFFKGKSIRIWNGKTPMAGWKARGNAAAAKDAIHTKDASLAYAQAVPDDFVLELNYHPTAFATRAAIVFAAGADGKGGYRLEWGGADENGRPEGIFRLKKGADAQTVAIHPDLCLLRMNYIKTWPGKIRIPLDAPHADLWYRIQIVKRGPRIEVHMNKAPSAGGNADPKAPTQPIVIWEDTRGLGGPALAGSALRLEQQGEGVWRNINLWQYTYAANETPPVPAKLRAEAKGNGRIVLTWRDGPDDNSGYLYDVYRAAKADFEPSAESLVIRGVRDSGYHDMGLAAGTTCYYKVRARNAMDRTSGYAKTHEKAKGEGASFVLIEAEDAARIELPFTAIKDAGAGFIRATATANMQDPGEKGGVAEYEVAIPQAGKYSLWARVIAPGDGSNSLWAESPTMAGGKPQLSHLKMCFEWKWQPLTGMTNQHLDKGKITLRLYPRENATQVDRLLLTDEPDWRPDAF